MPPERLLTILEMLSVRARHDEGGLLCGVTADVTGVAAVVIALGANDVPLTRFCASDALAESMIDLEITVGEGPCTLSVRGNTSVSEPDLSSMTSAQWLLFAPQALALGTRGVFGIPVRLGAIRLGALCLYRDTVGELSDQQVTDAYLMASVVGRGIVAMQAGAPPGSLSRELEREGDFDFRVHQAAGMVAVEALMSISSALISLRMHAFTTSQSLSNVSARVIARELRFDTTSQEWIVSTP